MASIFACAAFFLLSGHNCHADTKAKYKILEDQVCDNLSGMYSYDPYTFFIPATSTYLIINMSMTNAWITPYWYDGVSWSDIAGLNGIAGTEYFKDDDTAAGLRFYTIPIEGLTGTTTFRFYLTGGVYGVYNFSILAVESENIATSSLGCQVDDSSFLFNRATNYDDMLFQSSVLMKNNTSLSAITFAVEYPPEYIDEIQTPNYNTCSYSQYKVNTMGFSGNNAFTPTHMYIHPDENQNSCGLWTEFEYTAPEETLGGDSGLKISPQDCCADNYCFLPITFPNSMDGYTVKTALDAGVCYGGATADFSHLLDYYNLWPTELAINSAAIGKHYACIMEFDKNLSSTKVSLLELNYMGATSTACLGLSEYATTTPEVWCDPETLCAGLATSSFWEFSDNIQCAARKTWCWLFTPKKDIKALLGQSSAQLGQIFPYNIRNQITTAFAATSTLKLEELKFPIPKKGDNLNLTEEITILTTSSLPTLFGSSTWEILNNGISMLVCVAGVLYFFIRFFI